MQGQRGRNERRAGVFLDVAHLILGIAIVIFAVLSFFDPEGNEMLFPLVFLLAALLNGINGVFELKTCGNACKITTLVNRSKCIVIVGKTLGVSSCTGSMAELNIGVLLSSLDEVGLVTEAVCKDE